MKSSNPSISIGLLNNYKSSPQPVEFSNLSLSSNTGTFFYNSCRGSKIETSNQVTFQYNASAVTTIKEILYQNIGTYDVIGSLRWIKESILVTTPNGELPLRGSSL